MILELQKGPGLSDKPFIFACVPFSDVDECLKNNTNKCDSNAECANVIGSYNCTCMSGFHGNGFNCSGNVMLKFIYSENVREIRTYHKGWFDIPIKVSYSS